MQYQEWVSGSIFIRLMRIFAKGEGITGDVHNFDHTTIIFHGAASIKGVRPDGSVKEGLFKSPRPDWHGPSHALIEANVRHTITATEDNTMVWCVYSHRDPQGQVWLKYTGWDAAYQ